MPETVCGEPRMFVLSSRSREVPLDWLRKRGEREPDPSKAIRIAPGVRIRVMGWGDHLVPAPNPEGFEVVVGAMVAVWAADPLGFVTATFLRASGRPYMETCGMYPDRESAEAERAGLEAATAAEGTGERHVVAAVMELEDGDA